MTIFPAALGLLAFTAATTAFAAPTTKSCIELLVPVPVKATNIEYNIPRVDSTIDEVNWAINVTTWSSSNYTERIIRNITIDQAFNIHTKLCVPTKTTAKSSILQILTAGNGFDKRYWDAEVNPAKYNYIDAALAKGYSVLAYDKLGCGKSSKPNAYTHVQIPSEVEVLAGLTRLVRSGKLVTSSKINSPTASHSKIPDIFKSFKPNKIVQVAHSYGSVLLQALLAQYGNTLTDGAILTGFLLSSQIGVNNVAHFDHDFPRESDPARYGEYGSGYIFLSNKPTLQKLFFAKDGFEEKLLDYTEKIKQPETVGVYASEGTLQFAAAGGYTGPAMIMVGELDYPTCNGNCTGTNMLEFTESLFPTGKNNLTFHLEPGTGHVLTLAKSADKVAERIMRYLDDNGL
ncbi:Alpha/Beta hydrolase fold [Naviculisporaceae sp. PSN 640]